MADWTKEKAKRSALGGPYIGIHWRRRDFLYARRDQLPTIEGTADILQKLCEKLKLNRIYLATDAPEDEVNELITYLRNGIEVFRFTDSQKFNDPQIAIIDQVSSSYSSFYHTGLNFSYSAPIPATSSVATSPRSRSEFKKTAKSSAFRSAPLSIVSVLTANRTVNSQRIGK